MTVLRSDRFDPEAVHVGSSGLSHSHLQLHCSTGVLLEVRREGWRGGERDGGMVGRIAR